MSLEFESINGKRDAGLEERVVPKIDLLPQIRLQLFDGGIELVAFLLFGFDIDAQLLVGRFLRRLRSLSGKRRFEFILKCVQLPRQRINLLLQLFG